MEILRTDRLIIRNWLDSDSGALYEYGKNELVGPNAGWPPHKSEEESKEIIKMFKEHGETYAIVLKSENKVIGGIGLHDRKPHEDYENLNQREVGYVLNPKYWGRGIMPEAVDGLVEYGFENLDLDLIWCGHFDFNNNSRRVNEKCGFKYMFKKDEKLRLLGNKDVTTLYYCKFKSDYLKK